MKILSMIVLEREDRHILRHLEHAGNLAGVAEFDTHEMRMLRDSDPMTDQKRALFLDLKALRRVKSDQFEMSDLDRVNRFIRRLAAEKIARAKAGGVFADPAMQQQFSEGVKASAEQAFYELDLFLSRFEELMEQRS